MAHGALAYNRMAASVNAGGSAAKEHLCTRWRRSRARLAALPSRAGGSPALLRRFYLTARPPARQTAHPFCPEGREANTARGAAAALNTGAAPVH